MNFNDETTPEGVTTFIPGKRGVLSADSPQSSKTIRKKRRPEQKNGVGGKRRRRFSLLKWGVILLIWGFVLLGLGGLWFAYDLPDIAEMQLMPRRPSITVVDQQGTILATYGDLYGQAVHAKDLPAHVTQALLAIEDRRFYSHFGVDIWGLFRAAWVNYRAGTVVQGGSTITQQLAKNFLQSKKLYSPHDRSLRRKIQEAILAIWLEHRFTKAQILTMYLNRVYFGSGTYGIDGAARRYFGRPARELSLYEAAVLAGLLKAPSRYSPTQNPTLSEDRARRVLLSMVEAEFISEDAMKAALVMATPPPEVWGGSSVRYFTDWVVDMLPHLVDIQDRDVEIITTLDLRLQQIAEQKAKEIMETTGKKWGAGQVALLSLTRDGSVKAMLGGVNYGLSKFNRVTQALRQPGSAFKFFSFLTALEKGFTPETLVDDSPFRIGTWAPSNYKYRAQGEVTLYEAFSKSANSVAIRLMAQMGVDTVIQMARRLGITTPLPHNLTLALGTGEVTLMELTGAFATVANQGFQVIPHGIVQVRDRKGPLLYQWRPVQQSLISPRVARYMREMMEGVIKIGTGRSAYFGRPAAGKTGTTQKYHDLSFIGFTPELITGVWSGLDNGKPMTYVPKGSPSTHLWKAFMETALAPVPVQDFGDSLPFSEERKFSPQDGEDDHGPVEVPDSPVEEPGLLDQLLQDIFG